MGLLKQTTKTVTESEDLITVLFGAIPIITFRSQHHAEITSRLAMAINFLRSGCPGVQLLRATDDLEPDEFRVKVVELINLFSLDDEDIFFSEKNTDPIYYMTKAPD